MYTRAETWCTGKPHLNELEIEGEVRIKVTCAVMVSVRVQLERIDPDIMMRDLLDVFLRRVANAFSDFQNRRPVTSRETAKLRQCLKCF